MTTRQPLYKSLYFQVIVAICIGIALGHYYPQFGVAVKPLGDGFIKLIKMIIAPIIFCTVVSGIAGVKANKQAVVSNQTSLDATIVGLKVGTRTEIDVLNARQLLAAAQKSYYQSRYTYLNSLLALKQDAGRLGENDLAEIDKLVQATATPSQAQARSTR